METVKKAVQFVQDGWQNLMTGAGNALTDKGANTNFLLGTILTRGELAELYRGEGVSKKIVQVPVHDMTRAGFNIEGDSENSIIKALDKIQTRQAIKKALTWARLFGGSLLVMGINDAGRNSGKRAFEAPLNEGRIKSIDFFRVYDKSQVTWDTVDIDSNPSSENFGKPLLFKITPITEGSAEEFKVHYTRCIRFIGEELPEREAAEVNWWGDSVLQACYTRLRGFGNALIATESILDEFIVGILTINNLQDLIADGQEDLITKRLQQIDMSKHILNTMLVDKDEEFTRISATVNGIKDILEFLKDVLSAVSGIPQMKLFGEQSKGLGGESGGNIRMYYDDISEAQTTELEPKLRRIISLLLKSSSFQGPESLGEDWTISFNSLWQASAKETAEARLSTAKADEVYMAYGALSPKEVAMSRFGGETYSTDTNLLPESDEYRKKAENKITESSKTQSGSENGESDNAGSDAGEPGAD